MDELKNKKALQYLFGAGFIICAGLTPALLATAFAPPGTAQGALFWLFLTVPGALGSFRQFKASGGKEQVAKKLWLGGWLLGIAWASWILLGAGSSAQAASYQLEEVKRGLKDVQRSLNEIDTQLSRQALKRAEQQLMDGTKGIYPIRSTLKTNRNDCPLHANPPTMQAAVGVGLLQQIQEMQSILRYLLVPIQSNLKGISSDVAAELQQMPPGDRQVMYQMAFNKLTSLLQTQDARIERANTICTCEAGYIADSTGKKCIKARTTKFRPR
jgi:hypothetical protein